MQASPLSWPLEGLAWFLGRPQLWWRPLLATLGAWVVTAAAAIFVFWLALPAGGAGQSWWSWFLGLLMAVGWSALTAMLGWLALVPLVIGFAFEDLVKRVLVERGVAISEEGMLPSIRSAAQVLLRNIGWVVLWPVATLLCTLFMPPLALVVSQFGLAHITILEAGDIALALRGRSGAERTAIMADQRRAVFMAAAVAAALAIALAATVILWPLWPAAVFTGAALWISGREDLPLQPSSAPAGP